MSVITEKYPIKNPIWHEHDDGSFTARTDPWNRPLPVRHKVNKNNEREITHWDFMTSVAGLPVELTIWND